MAALNELIEKIENPALRAQIQAEAKKLLSQKTFGLVFEEHLPECTPIYDIPVRKGLRVSVRGGKANETYTVLNIENGKAFCLPRNGTEAVILDVSKLVVTAELGDPIYPCLRPMGEVCHAPDSDLWHTLIEADNYHALQLLEYLYAGKVDCIYIDPPYNTGARDWKYNNDYVDGTDEYRHSKWLSFMKKRLQLAKRLLNPTDSVLIVTIDEKEYLHLGCLLEELFVGASIQMISCVTNAKGVARDAEFYRVNEYIYVIRIGNCGVSALPLPSEWKGNIKTSTTEKVRWGSLMRSGTNSERAHSPGCFYPIFISEDKKSFCGAGMPLAAGQSRHDIPVPKGQIAIFPIHSDGTEGCWQYSRERFLAIQQKGYVRISTQTKNEATIRYISKGWQKRVEGNQIQVIGKAPDGSLIFDDSEYVQEYIPCNQWWISSHNATEFGSKLIQNMIGKRFSFPKSLYAVQDTLRFFVANKPHAFILDFFAGSGTTLHAVNLLNAEDGGHRRCIMVTNNEISEDEKKEFEARGLKPGDDEWECKGIARYVTWPRTVCSIEGHDINGNPLKGAYIGSERPMADGFSSNVAFFKLGFLDKTKVSLGMQLKELLSTLWMKAGAVGRCPALQGPMPDMLILPENKMAILHDENHFAEFAEALAQNPEIAVVYLATDYESSFVAMTQALGGKQTYQLYRDYLDNFRINAGRNSR